MFRLLILLLVIIFTSCTGTTSSEEYRFKKQLGTYEIDLRKTNLGIYGTDSNSLKDLTITFYPDSTFKLNQDVPFLFSEFGTWRPGGSSPESWNYLQYNDKSSDQFDQCCDSDSTFYINSTTPKPGRIAVSKVYFKKVRSTN